MRAARTAARASVYAAWLVTRYSGNATLQRWGLLSAEDLCPVLCTDDHLDGPDVTHAGCGECLPYTVMLAQIDDDLETRYLRAQRRRFDFSLDVPHKGDQLCALPLHAASVIWS